MSQVNHEEFGSDRTRSRGLIKTKKTKTQAVKTMYLLAERCRGIPFQPGKAVLDSPAPSQRLVAIERRSNKF